MRSPGAAFDLRAALSDEIRNAMRELDSAPAPDPKAVHRCRVHLKRARALARVGRAVQPNHAAAFNASARSVMRSLAQARDLASLSTYARNLTERAGKKTSNALSTIADKLDDARMALPPLDLEAVRTDLQALLAMARVWRDVSDRQIERGAERLARRARRAFRKGRGEELAVHRHEWRKREKDRLYAVTLLQTSWPDGRKRRKKRGEKLAEALGRERDALMLIERLERNPLLAGSEVSAKRVLRLLDLRRRKYGRRADGIGARLHRGGA